MAIYSIFSYLRELLLPIDNCTYFDDPAYAHHPVVYMNWEQSNQFAQWLGGGLPTEAQWEYAARGPQGYEYPWGNTEPTCDLLNFDYCVGGMTTVGSYPGGVSWVGAVDMVGNVWEWVADWYYEEYPSDDQFDPTGPAEGSWRVGRGASFTNEGIYVRAAYRGGDNPNSLNHISRYGLRVAAPISP